MAYVITGATGHIGNNLVRRLVQENQPVTVLLRRMDPAIANLPITYVLGDILDIAFLRAHITKDDIVIHLAGMIDIKNNQKQATYHVNYEGTKYLTDICIEKQVQKYLYVSSVDAIAKPNQTAVIAEPQQMFPSRLNSNYGSSKALATAYVMKARQDYPQIPIHIVYPSAVIGTNDWKPSALGKVIRDCIDGKPQFGIRGGYNFVDVDDVVTAIIQITAQTVTGDFILSGENKTVIELYRAVNQVLGRPRRIYRIPLGFVYCAIPFVPYLSKFALQTLQENHNYDATNAIKALSWDITPFEETIAKTVKWFNKQKNV